jgi:hypothetical protein
MESDDQIFMKSRAKLVIGYTPLVVLSSNYIQKF